MKKNCIVFVSAVTCGCAALAQTPFEMAMELERELASGIGILMPDPGIPFVNYHGVLPLPEPDPSGFPQGFLDGLVSTQQYGFATWPVTLRADDVSGDTVFRNADGTLFWSESPSGIYSADWILQLHGNPPAPMDELLLPSHVEAQWTFVAEEDIAAYHEATLASLKPQGPAAPPPPSNLPVLNVTAFAPAADAYLFASAWNSTAYFPLSLMDVWFTPSLTAPDWSVVKTVPVSNTGNRTAFFEVPQAALPPPPPPAEHGPGCTPVTSVMPSPLDPAVSYTNTTCGCAATKPRATGFFRLGIVDNGIIPAWWRVMYGLSPWDSWEDGIDFNGDGHTTIGSYELGLNPVAPPVAAGGAAVQYNYDGDDRLTHTFVGADGDAAVRDLTPAGNPQVQQERNTP